MARLFSITSETDSAYGLRRRSTVAAVATGVVLLTLTWLLWHISMQYLNLRLQEAIHESSDQAIARLESFLDDRMVALRRVAQFCLSSDNLMENEFETFTNSVLGDVPGILCVVRTDGTGVPTWQTPKGALTREQVFLLTGNPQLQPVLKRAQANNQLSVTDALDIPERGSGFLVAFPLSRGGRSEGFVIGIFTYQELLNYLLDPELLQHYHIAIQQAGHVIFPALGGASFGFDSRINRLNNVQQPYQTNKVTYIGGQEWEMTVEPVDPPTAPQSVASLSILALGVTLSIVLSIFAFLWVLRAGQLRAEAQASLRRLEDTGMSLVEIKAELDLILNSVDEGIILYDANLKPLQANAPFLAMFGLGEGGVPGGISPNAAGLRQAHHVYMARLVGSESRYLALFRTLQRHPEQLYIDEVEMAPEGEQKNDRNADKALKRNFVRRAMAISGASGQRKGLMVIYKEVTSVKAVNQAKDEFLAGVTHELRSPLSAIKGFAETMRPCTTRGRRTLEDRPPARKAWGRMRPA